MNKNTILKSFLLAGLAVGFVGSAYAGNTVMEPFGKLSEQFSASPELKRVNAVVYGSFHSEAPGTTGGGNSAGHSQDFNPIVATFTPGTTAINYTPAAGVDYGNGQLATGLSHSATSGTGLYNIFFTMPTHPDALIAGGQLTFTIQSDSGFKTAYIVDQNAAAIQDTWTLLATVPMATGHSYMVSSVSQYANENSTADQGYGGIMFEPIPEPSTYAAIFGGLALVGAFVYRRRLSAKK